MVRGERMVTQGYYMTSVDLRGYTPPHTRGQEGGPVRPCVRRGPVGPKVYRHLASALQPILGRSGARASASHGRVWPVYTHLFKEQGGIPPFDYYPKQKYIPAFHL